MMAWELKELLRNVPDDFEVILVMNYADEAIYQHLDQRRTGIRGAIAALIDPPPTKFDQSFHCWAATAIAKVWPGKKHGELRLSNGGHCPSIVQRDFTPESPETRIVVVRQIPQLSDGRQIEGGKV